MDAAGDRLSVVGWTATQGRDPRFIAVTPDGGRLLVANEQGDKIVAFAIEAATGRLSPSGVVASSGSPAAIAFL